MSIFGKLSRAIPDVLRPLLSGSQPFVPGSHPNWSSLSGKGIQLHIVMVIIVYAYAALKYLA